MNKPFASRHSSSTTIRSYDDLVPAGQKTPRVHTRVIDWCNDHRHLVVIFAACLMALGWWWLNRPAPTAQPAKVTAPTSSQSSKTPKKNTDTTPKFATLLPKSKSIESLGGWTRVSPETSDPVFAFKDTLDNTPIIVSQQPLPQSFSGATDEQLTELAKEYNATERLPFSGGLAFVGTSAKGPQSVIATKNGLLILIKSTVKHSDDSWTRYLADLN
ncbi:hypothetical protein LCH21_03260 [Patescibacteria group bacterium]|nr:hypothetical protein [Patescibacteria group bacterium]